MTPAAKEMHTIVSFWSDPTKTIHKKKWEADRDFALLATDYRKIEKECIGWVLPKLYPETLQMLHQRIPLALKDLYLKLEGKRPKNFVKSEAPIYFLFRAAFLHFKYLEEAAQEKFLRFKSVSVENKESFIRLLSRLCESEEYKRLYTENCKGEDLKLQKAKETLEEFQKKPKNRVDYDCSENGLLVLNSLAARLLESYMLIRSRVNEKRYLQGRDLYARTVWEFEELLWQKLGELAAFCRNGRPQEIEIQRSYILLKIAVARRQNLPSRVREQFMQFVNAITGGNSKKLLEKFRRLSDRHARFYVAVCNLLFENRVENSRTDWDKRREDLLCHLEESAVMEGFHLLESDDEKEESDEEVVMCFPSLGPTPDDSDTDDFIEI